MNYKIEFLDSDKPEVTLNEGDCLSEKLNIQNSPILFGCRIGICGTCAIEIVSTDSPLSVKTHAENEFLSAIAPDREDVRLACQIRINTNMKIRKTEI